MREEDHTLGNAIRFALNQKCEHLELPVFLEKLSYLFLFVLQSRCHILRIQCSPPS